MNQESNEQGASRLESGVAKWLHRVLFGCGAGGGAALIFFLAEKQPIRLIEMLEKFGPIAFLFLVTLLMLNQSVKTGISTMRENTATQIGVLRENAAAQQKLADAVAKIAERDDREREEQRRLLSYVGSQQEKILASLANIERQSGQHTRGAHA